MPVSYRTSYALHRASGKGDSPAVARWRHRRLHGIGLGYVHRENQGTEKSGAQGEESGEDRVSQGQIAQLRAHLSNTDRTAGEGNTSGRDDQRVNGCVR